MDAAMQMVSQAKVEKNVGAGLSGNAIGNLGVTVITLEMSASAAILGALVGSLVSNTRRGTTIGALAGAVLGAAFGGFSGYEAKAAAT